MLRVPVFLTIFLLLPPVSAEEKSPALTFENDIRPIFKAACFHCHGESEELAGNLDLRLKRLLLKGGDSGAAIVPGDAAKSLLMTRLHDGEMPPPDEGKPLTTAQVEVITRWINSGAHTARPEPEQIGKGLIITKEDREFWAFQPVTRPQLPTVKQPDLISNPIDTFILHRLENAGLSFTPRANRRTLIRRLHWDLLGLPPTPEQVQEFEQDTRPDAYERLIDQLLASPHYGARWGQFWLDVAGYADSEGVVNDDPVRRWAWKYRDYVIRAHNADLPFDEFIQAQLAGDEMVSGPHAELSPDDLDKLTATGFLRTAPDGTATSGVDRATAQNQMIADTIEIVSTSLLGLTVNCAQCHEHRYDPIPQADYYRMRAIFEPAMNPKQWKTPVQRQVSLYRESDKKLAAELEKEAKAKEAERTKKQNEFIEAVFQKELAKLPEEIKEEVATARNTAAKKRTKEQKALIQKYPSVNVTAGSLYLYDSKAAKTLKDMAAEAAAIRARKPKQEFLRVLTEPTTPPPKTFLFYRGDHQQPKEEVVPAGLTIVNSSQSSEPLPINQPDLPTTGRRLAYAHALTSGEHPLVARVIVNRVWLHHFGRGLVNTPGDFGQLGERPSHPQLLDWLASEFVRQNWSLKQLHRIMLTSTAYQQALRVDKQHQQIDPDNTLFGGARLRRVDAESLRDSMLSASGMLNPKPFGPPIPIMANVVGEWVIGKENLNAGRPGAVIPMNGEEFRRSIFIEVRRSRPLAVLETFDRPAMAPNCTTRPSSTVATQSLMLMNGLFSVAQSKHLTKRLTEEAGSDPIAQVKRLWQLVYQREPSEEELTGATEYLREQTTLLKHDQTNKNSELQSLASLCQLLFSSNEFLYLD